MHQHRLVLNGPPAAVARLAGDLCAAGAVAVAGPTAGPPRLVWRTDRPRALARVCEGHRDVAVGVERFELLGDELQRLVVQGSGATVLERRPVAGSAQQPVEEAGGLCVEEDGAPLDATALRAAAAHVLVSPVDGRPGPTGSPADDAVLVGAALGRMCATVDEDGPALAGQTTVAALAATALTLGTAGACAAQQGFERDWRLTQAAACARSEQLWARPGEADWPEWLMELLAGAARVIEGCAACLHQPPPSFVSVHTEHVDTEVEQLDRAARRLVCTALQALVLFPVQSRV
jgi:hypothetical protein